MFTLGRRDAADEPSARLLACHERIRRFLAMAERLASTQPAPEDDVRATAAAVARYFEDALPLHERDEDESVTAALAGGASPDVARALDVMRAQHREMDPMIGALTAACRRIARAPAPSAQRLADQLALADTLARLVPRMTDHLAAEEGIIVPAIDALPAAARAALVGAMRARREPPRAP